MYIARRERRGREVAKRGTSRNTTVGVPHSCPNRPESGSRRDAGQTPESRRRRGGKRLLSVVVVSGRSRRNGLLSRWSEVRILPGAYGRCLGQQGLAAARRDHSPAPSGHFVLGPWKRRWPASRSAAPSGGRRWHRSPLVAVMQ